MMLGVVVAVLAVTGLATRPHPVTNAVSHVDAQVVPASAPAAEQPYYFPSQYELHAGPPEAPIEAF
jgi:hypothetical protein